MSNPFWRRYLRHFSCVFNGSRKGRPIRRAPSFTLRLEQLETRLAPALVFNSGQVSVFNGTEPGSVSVRDNPNPPPLTTTLDVTGGSIGYGGGSLIAYDSSIVNVSGGSVGFGSGSLDAFNSSTVNVSGGTVAYVGTVNAHNSSVINLSGGQVAYVGTVNAYNTSKINISGGSVANLGNLSAHDSGIISIFGSGFNLPYGPLTQTTGTLTGTLEDGSAFNVQFVMSSHGEIVLSQPAPTVTVTVAGGVYNGAPHAVTAASVTGNANTVLASFGDPSLSYTYYVGATASGTGSASAPINAGTYTVVAHWTSNNPNYVSADSAPATFVITPAPLSVTGITANNKVYDSTTSASLNTGSAALAGTVYPGDTVTLVTAGATGTFASKDVGNAITVNVAGLALDGAQAGNYVVTQPTTTANITPAPLTVAGITADKVYDGTTAAILNAASATLSGVFSGDTVTLNSAAATGVFASKDVGNGITVVVTGLTLDGAQASDYSLTQPTVTANITPAPLTVTGITASGKVYDATTAATLNTTNAALTGVFSGDTVTLNSASAKGTFASKDAANGITVTVTGLTLQGTQAGDYSLTQPTVTANITPAPLTVTGITANDKVYDATSLAALNTANGALAGVFSGDAVTLAGATGTFASKDVGKGIAVTGNLSLDGAQAGDYSLTQPTTTANITPAPLTVSGITADKVYDATTVATLNTANASLAGLFGGDTVTLDASAAKSTFASKDVGTGIAVSVSGLALGGAQASDYSLTQPALTANITPAPLTVTRIAADKVYDGTTAVVLNPAKAALVGVFSGDTVTLNTANVTGMFASKDAGTGVAVTLSGLSLGGAQAGNYSLQQTTTANITPAPLTVAGITANDKVYDATTTASLNTTGASLTGVLSGDTVTLNASGATGTFATKDVGTGIVVAVSGLSLGGAQAGDYVVTQPTTTANITPAPLTVTGITADKVYDATTAAIPNTANAALAGAFSGDTVTLNAAAVTGTFASKDVGTGITVTVSGLTLAGAQAGDYSLTQPTVTANITPATLTVTGITANDKVYDATTAATLNTANAALAGKVYSGDTVTLSITSATGTFASKDVGNGITVGVSGLTLGGAQAGDYTLTQPTPTANITPATLTVSGITANDKVYDATTAATLDTANAALAGVLGGDTVTLDAAGAKGAFVSKDAGSGVTVAVSGLTLGGAQAGDYTLTQPTTTANITPATLTVTGITANSKVYDATTAATLNTANAVLAGVLGGDTVTLNAAGATGAFASKDVGNGIAVAVSGLTLAGGQASDYTLTQPTTTANITPAPLTVTGITADKVYDATTAATLDTTNAALVGVFSGDTVTLNASGATGTFASKDAGTGIAVAVSGLTLDGAQAADYSLTQPTVTANITPAPLTVTGITANDKVYDATTAATLGTANAALTGTIFAGDTVTLSTSGATGTFASKDAGAGVTVTVSGLTLAGSQAGDYTLTPTTTTANITPAALTVTGITANNKVFDGTTAATLNMAGASLAGVFSGDTVTLNTTGAVGTFASADVGNDITVAVSGLTLDGAQAGDYVLTQPTTTANITALPPVLSHINPTAAKPGAVIQVFGTGFQPGSQVFIGGVLAVPGGASTGTILKVVVPNLTVGTADVKVVNPDGQQSMLPGIFFTLPG
jgi:hypothetical protein